jgi:hypothetical protein
VIASADMYYTEEGQRDIFAYDNLVHGLRIWGETLGGGTPTRINLCQIFLEYGLCCQTLPTREQSYQEMRAFGEDFGAKLAEYIKNSALVRDTVDPGACALESILEAIQAHLTIEHIGLELRFVVAGCPLLDASQNTGLAETELAQFGFNVMCQRVIQVIDPDLVLNVPIGNDRGQVFTLLKPTHLAVEPGY